MVFLINVLLSFEGKIGQNEEAAKQILEEVRFPGYEILY